MAKSPLLASESDHSEVSGGFIIKRSVGLPGHRFSEDMGTLEPSACALIVPRQAPHLTLEYQFAHENTHCLLMRAQLTLS